MTQILLPAKSQTKQAVLETMKAARDHDVKWREGRVFSLVFNAGDEVSDMLKEAYDLYFSENGLNPTAFPSLKKFETEVVSMVASLLHADDDVVGNMTTGGTESLLMAVKTARNYARAAQSQIKIPEVILPITAHPAFEKAAEYFDVKLVHVPVRADYRADMAAMEAAITPNTIMLVGSAPSYPQGVVDPIRDLAQVAVKHHLLLHVDACVGGLLLPFVRKLGHTIPDFDFAIPGVTSISADLHKYGYAAKGASVILYRNSALRRHMFFSYIDWAGGVYVSPTMTGTRPGGPIAAAWAIMNFLGEEGYLRLANIVMQTVRKVREGIAALPEVRVLSNPDMSVMALVSDKLDMYQIGDELTVRGWHLDRQQFPPSLHMTIVPAHALVADQFLSDLKDAIAAVKKPSVRKVTNQVMVSAANGLVKVLPDKWASKLTAKSSAFLGASGEGLPQRSAAMYGLIGTLPNRGDLNELVIDLLDQLTKMPDRKA
ncbi:MAG TPA: aspartate aminotransferase family protein [Anaerolineae bacterium]|nr:aspartate aminotransferase family protein [Anaerolineae bacterium]